MFSVTAGLRVCLPTEQGLKLSTVNLYEKTKAETKTHAQNIQISDTRTSTKYATREYA